MMNAELKLPINDRIYALTPQALGKLKVNGHPLCQTYDRPLKAWHVDE